MRYDAYYAHTGRKLSKLKPMALQMATVEDPRISYRLARKWQDFQPFSPVWQRSCHHLRGDFAALDLNGDLAQTDLPRDLLVHETRGCHRRDFLFNSVQCDENFRHN
ncbi:hypothetical protein ACWKW9_12790 [Rhizobium daejeonense]